MKIRNDGDDGSDGDDGDDDEKDNCGGGDGSDDGNNGLFGFQGSSSHLPKHNYLLYPAFLPKPLHTFTHTHTHTHTHAQCLIKANILIIDDKALYMNLRNTGQSP